MPIVSLQGIDGLKSMIDRYKKAERHMMMWALLVLIYDYLLQKLGLTNTLNDVLFDREASPLASMTATQRYDCYCLGECLKIVVARLGWRAAFFATR